MVFDPSLGAGATEIDLMVGDLHRALHENELLLLYQPKLALVTGRVVGVEALLRWNHPDYGVISPDHFIPLAEKTGLIVDLGRWVLDAVCRRVRDWRAQQAVKWTVAINVSVIEINSLDDVDIVRAALARHGVAPAELMIEVTESAAMRNAELSLTVLRKLAQLGVRLSLDDFGVGYSSLSHLKRFPVHELKIDRSFVCALAEDRVDRAIVKAIVVLARSLGMRVVAEGVEHLEQQVVLAELECDLIQGYWISQPVVAARVPQVIAGIHQSQGIAGGEPREGMSAEPCLADG